VDNQSVESAIPNQSITAVAPGSWAYVRRGQPNEEVTVDVKNAQATEETRGSDMVAEGMLEVHTAHATSTPVMETSKALQ
jgi:hypothetical protein